MPTVAIASPPDPDADAVVKGGLRAHLEPVWGTTDRTYVSVYARNDGGEVVGGAICYVSWGWLYVDRLWVDAVHRRRGLGADLLAATEAFALDQGCHGVYLDTFGDEALGFYRRCGYEVWGTLDDQPPGGRKHCLRKLLHTRYPT